MAKHKSGLHKKVSSIFDGITVSRTDTNNPSMPVANNSSENNHPINNNLQKNIGPDNHLPSEKPSTPESPPAPFKKATKPKNPTAPKRGEYKLFAPIPGVNNLKQKIIISLLSVSFLVFMLVLISTFTKELDIVDSDSNANEELSMKLDSQDVLDIDWQIPPVYSPPARDPMIPSWKKNIDIDKRLERYVTKNNISRTSTGAWDFQEDDLLNEESSQSTLEVINQG